MKNLVMKEEEGKKVRLDNDRHKRLSFYAVEHELTLKFLIEQAIDEFLARHAGIAEADKLKREAEVQEHTPRTEEEQQLVSAMLDCLRSKGSADWKVTLRLLLRPWLPIRKTRGSPSPQKKRLLG